MKRRLKWCIIWGILIASPFSLSGKNRFYHTDRSILIIDTFLLKWQLQLNLHFGLKRQSYLSLHSGLGLMWRGAKYQQGLSFSANLYNGGLGTQQGVTKKADWQADFVLAPSFTLGSRNYAPMPIPTFNGMTLNGLENSFRSSFSYSLNWVMNTQNRNQLVGSVGFRVQDFAFQTYNDLKVLTLWLGNDDRWWTGGGQASVLINHQYVLTLGTEVFTGERSRPFRSLNNEYIQPDQKNRNLNNGQTFLRLNWGNDQWISQISCLGSGQMWSQNGIHNILGYPIFKSNTVRTFQISQGARLIWPR